MAFCTKCGAQMEDGAKFCSACGQTVDAAAEPETEQTAQQQAASAANNFAATVQNLNNTADTTAEYDPADIQNGKGMSVLAYFGILCLIPMFVEKSNRFVKFHVNQGFTLMLAGIALSIINFLAGVIFAKRWLGITVGYSWPYYIFAVICWIGFIIVGVLAIIGIVNACKGKAKELPIIGKIRILK